MENKKEEKYGFKIVPTSYYQGEGPEIFIKDKYDFFMVARTYDIKIIFSWDGETGFKRYFFPLDRTLFFFREQLRKSISPTRSTPQKQASTQEMSQFAIEKSKELIRKREHEILKRPFDK